MFDCIGRKAVATKVALIGSASNLPWPWAIPLIGAVQTRHGSNAMLLTEAGLAAASLVAYALVARLTEARPGLAAVAPATS